MKNTVRARREELRMTQEELAERSGVSRTTISALESGTERSSTTKTLFRIADALDSTVDKIFFAQDV